MGYSKVCVELGEMVLGNKKRRPSMKGACPKGGKHEIRLDNNKGSAAVATYYCPKCGYHWAWTGLLGLK